MFSKVNLNFFAARSFTGLGYHTCFVSVRGGKTSFWRKEIKRADHSFSFFEQERLYFNTGSPTCCLYALGNYLSFLSGDNRRIYNTWLLWGLTNCNAWASASQEGHSHPWSWISVLEVLAVLSINAVVARGGEGWENLEGLGRHLCRPGAVVIYQQIGKNFNILTTSKTITGICWLTTSPMWEPPKSLNCELIMRGIMVS